MPKEFLKNGSKMFFAEQKSILSAAAVIAAMSLLASLLGLIKMRLYAGVVGVGAELDTFIAAFKLPDLIFSLVVLGTINAAFIPIFSDFISHNNKEAAWRFASNIINLGIMLLTIAALALFVLARPLSALVAAGFPPERSVILVHLMRIMLLSPVLLGVSSFVGGAIQSFRRFWVPFLAPVVYNLGAIFGVLFLYRPWGVDGLAWGVVLGSFLHLLVQVPLLRHLGFKYQLIWSTKDAALQETLRLAGPRVLGILTDQIKTVLVVNLASLLTVGSISVLRFAESIFLVPVALVGGALAQASFPSLSFEFARRQSRKFQEILTSSFLQILYLAVPASVVLILLKIPVVRLVLGIGRFDWGATKNVAWVLALLSIALPALATAHLLTRGFYALRNTKTPVFIGAIGSLVSVGLAVLLLPFYQIKGVALALSGGAWLEVLLLGWFLVRAVRLDPKKLLAPVLKILTSGFLMAVCIYVPYRILDREFLDTQRVVNLLILVWLVLSFGGSIYFISSWILGVRQVRILTQFLWRLRYLRETLTEVRELPSAPPVGVSEENLSG